jgi:PTS system mannose-specific IIC component
LLASWFDVLQGIMATGFIHGADKALKNNNIKGFELWHLNGTWTIMICNFVPIFIGMLFIDKYQIIVDFVDKYSWFENGINVVGAMLPAVGFGMLLSYMDIKHYWPFMIIGYVLFAYLGLPTLGLALFGIAIAYLYAFKIKTNPLNEEVSVDVENE